MELISTIALWIHIAAGFTAFFVGPGAMLTKKGKLWHRRWGKVFFWGMAVVAGTALVLTKVQPDKFLTLVAIFSFYSAFSGYRVLYHKRPDKGQLPKSFDWIAAGITLTTGIGLLYMGLFNIGTFEFRFQPIMFTFGIICIGLAGSDIRRFLAEFNADTDKYNWWYTHMGNMTGAYIAAVTAFSAVNFSFLPPVVRWLWPTFLGVPALIIWTRYYRKKFEGKSVMAKSALPEKGSLGNI